RDVTLNDRFGDVRYVTSIVDPFGNSVTFTYFDAPGPIDGVSQIHQVLSAAESRDVTFTYDATYHALASMTYLNHTWRYDQVADGPDGYSALTAVHPPAGPGSGYAYSG